MNDTNELATLRAERDALREAMERLTGISWAVGSLALDDALAQARAALARCKVTP